MRQYRWAIKDLLCSSIKNLTSIILVYKRFEPCSFTNLVSHIIQSWFLDFKFIELNNFYKFIKTERICFLENNSWRFSSHRKCSSMGLRIFNRNNQSRKLPDSFIVSVFHLFVDLKKLTYTDRRQLFHTKMIMKGLDSLKIHEQKMKNKKLFHCFIDNFCFPLSLNIKFFSKIVINNFRYSC